MPLVCQENRCSYMLWLAALFNLAWRERDSSDRAYSIFFRRMTDRTWFESQVLCIGNWTLRIYAGVDRLDVSWGGIRQKRLLYRSGTKGHFRRLCQSCAGLCNAFVLSLFHHKYLFTAAAWLSLALRRRWGLFVVSLKWECLSYTSFSSFGLFAMIL